MQVKNISPVSQTVIVTDGFGNRVVKTVKPGAILDMLDIEGKNLIENSGKEFAPSGAGSQAIVNDYEPILDGKEMRKDTGTEKQAEKEIARGKKMEKME